MSDSKDNSTKTKNQKLLVLQHHRDQIVELSKNGYGTRKIVPRVGCSRKIVRRVLREEGCLAEKEGLERKKIEGFEEFIEQKAKKGLTVTRILREIKELGYAGSRTILAEHVRNLRDHLDLSPSVKQIHRRFETAPGKETQIDWSPYEVNIAGQSVVVKALGCLLCYSRKLFLYFFFNERQTTLFEGLAMAFEYFGGCTTDLILDNMATAIVARYGTNGQPIFQKPFVEFTTHYGTTPKPCHTRDPKRKGKKEKSFRLVQSDFLKGTEFESMDDLNRRAKLWLDHTPECANLRVHGTTKRVPNEAYLEERALLIQLPHERFPVYEQSVRTVDSDCTISVKGQRYTVPAALANKPAVVHLFAEHFAVLDRYGHVAFARKYANHGKRGPPIVDETHYANLPRRQRRGQMRVHEAFLKRYPDLEPLVSGLFEKMKSLTPIHVRHLIRLAEGYGDKAFMKAATRAQQYRRYDSRAVERILENQQGAPRYFPIDLPLGGAGPLRIGEVEQGSMDDYGYLDEIEPQIPKDNED